jgi:hypothetical protein
MSCRPANMDALVSLGVLTQQVRILEPSVVAADEL